MDLWRSALKRAEKRPRVAAVAAVPVAEAVQLPVAIERPGRLDVARAVELGDELEALLAACPPELRETWAERAAVAEFDGGLDRREAELLAAAGVFGSAVAWVDVARDVFGGWDQVTLESVEWGTSDGQDEPWGGIEDGNGSRQGEGDTKAASGLGLGWFGKAGP
jgi:hypothetical protein